MKIDGSVVNVNRYHHLGCEHQSESALFAKKKKKRFDTGRLTRTQRVKMKGKDRRVKVKLLIVSSK